MDVKRAAVYARYSSEEQTGGEKVQPSYEEITNAERQVYR